MISIVIPIYNEARIVREAAAELCHKLDDLRWEYELILSENGSVVKRYRQADGRNDGPRTQVSAYPQMCDQPIASNESRNPFGPRCTLRRKS